MYVENVTTHISLVRW